MFPSIGKQVRTWLGLPSLVMLRFEFRGWNDSQVQAAVHGSVDLRDEEIRAKRSGPAHPPGIWEITSSDEQTTAVGAFIRVLVDPAVIGEAEVQAYLRQIGIDTTPTSV